MLDFRNANEVFSIYGTYPNEQGEVESRLLGRIVIANGKLSIIEDHWKLKTMLTEGPVEGLNERKLQSLAHSSYARIVTEGDAHRGKHLDLIKPRDFGGVPRHMRGIAPADMPQVEEGPDEVESTDQTPAPESINNVPGATGQFTLKPPPAVFDYLRVGMTKPEVVEVHGHEVFMNGQKLGQDEVERLLETVKTGIATLRYRRAI